jgi:hypothetical protein
MGECVSFPTPNNGSASSVVSDCRKYGLVHTHT